MTGQARPTFNRIRISKDGAQESLMWPKIATNPDTVWLGLLGLGGSF